MSLRNETEISPPSSFGSAEASYKTIRGFGIPATIWFPTSNEPQRNYPVAVRWHGGGLVTGSRLTRYYVAEWIPQLVEQEKAVLVSPDYRLLPEANGLEMLEDMKDFWDWLLRPGELSKHLPANVIPELNRILVIGESGGGYMALQSALSPAADHLAAAILQYPLIDIKDRYYSEAYEEKASQSPFPQEDPQIFKDHVASIRHDAPFVTAGSGSRRQQVLFVMAQQGLYVQLLGQDPSIYPLEVVSSVHKLPPTWFLHGIDDSVVLVGGTHKFIDCAKKLLPDWKVHTSYPPGEHMFDKPMTLETDLIAEGIDFVSRFWPQT